MQYFYNYCPRILRAEFRHDGENNTMRNVQLGIVILSKLLHRRLLSASTVQNNRDLCQDRTAQRQKCVRTWRNPTAPTDVDIINMHLMLKQ